MSLAYLARSAKTGARDFSKTPAAVALWFSCEWFGKALAEHRADLAAGVLKTSFLPGRSFSGPADFNTQLAEWLERVNQRPRRALGCAPCDRIVAERQQMLTLPPVPPATGWRIWLYLAASIRSVHIIPLLGAPNCGTLRPARSRRGCSTARRCSAPSFSIGRMGVSTGRFGEPWPKILCAAPWSKSPRYRGDARGVHRSHLRPPRSMRC